MADYLFVYGTLKPEFAPAEMAAVVRRLRFVGKGSIRGVLYYLGEYPGLRLDAAGNKVQGEIFELSDPSILGVLDEYEGYDPRNSGRSLFIRKQCQVRLNNVDEQLLCWVYEYNHEPADSLRIDTWPPNANA